MEPNLPVIRQILEILAETPGRIAAAAAGVSQPRLARRPDPRTWSAVEILAHLRACADTWGSSIDSMLADEEPSIPDIHPRLYIKQTDYPSLDFLESLEAFSRQRRELLKRLESIPLEEWERGALIGTRRHTVFTQARRMAKHEEEHCLQLKKILTPGGIH